MRLPPRTSPKLLDVGSPDVSRHIRKPDAMLAVAVAMRREMRRDSWAEAQHVKDVRRLEREAAEARRERDSSSFWFRVRTDVQWRNSVKSVRKPSAFRSAISLASGVGRLPSYGFVLRDRLGRQLVFMRIRYSSAAKTKQGRAAYLSNYSIEGAHILTNGTVAFSSNIGETKAEIAAGCELFEQVNRAAAKNAKVVFHAIFQSCHALTPGQQFEMAKAYAEDIFGRQDLPYVVALHPPDENGDQRNWHAHIVYTYRPMVRTGEGEWNVGKFLRTDLDCAEQFTRLRSLWAEALNHACEQAGLPNRFTHLSYQALGMDVTPQEHLCGALSDMVRRGEAVFKNMRNYEAVIENSVRHLVRQAEGAVRSVAGALQSIAEEECSFTMAAAAAVKSMKESWPEPIKKPSFAGPIAASNPSRLKRPESEEVASSANDNASAGAGVSAEPVLKAPHFGPPVPSELPLPERLGEKRALIVLPASLAKTPAVSKVNTSRMSAPPLTLSTSVFQNEIPPLAAAPPARAPVLDKARFDKLLKERVPDCGLADAGRPSRRSSEHSGFTWHPAAAAHCAARGKCAERPFPAVRALQSLDRP